MSTTRDQAEKLRFWFQRSMINESASRVQPAQQKSRPSSPVIAGIVPLFLIVIAIIAAIVAYRVFMDMRQRYEKAVQVVQRAENELNDRVASLSSEISDLRAQTAVADEQQEAIRESLSELSVANADLVGSIGRLREENATLSGALVQARQDLRETESEKSELADRLRKQSDILQRKVDYLNSVIANNASGSDQMIDPQAKIVHINRDLKFAVINRGVQEGIQQNTRYEVIRDNKRIGVVTIVEARQGVSAGDVLDGVDTIQEGDMVRVP